MGFANVAAKNFQNRPISMGNCQQPPVLFLIVPGIETHAQSYATQKTKSSNRYFKKTFFKL
jgi:hypothetical protein